MKRTPSVFAAMRDEASRVGETTALRKHHLVPASYLQRWAEGGRIRVTELDSKSDYPNSFRKAARETDFYSLKSENVDPDVLPPLLMEVWLGKIEEAGKRRIDELLTAPSLLQPALVGELSNYLGFQFARGAASRRARMTLSNELAKLQYASLTDEQIARKLIELGHEPTQQLAASSRRLFDRLKDGSVRMVPERAEMVSAIVEVAEETSKALIQRQWVLLQTPKVLVTSDEPVVPIGGPGQDRSRRAGIGTAAVVIFPLSPSHLLAMVHPDDADRSRFRTAGNGRLGHDEIDHLEVSQVSAEIAAHAYRWCFERPAKRVAARLNVPLAPPPANFEYVGGDPAGERLYRLSSLNRWSNASTLPPWPVARWWE